MLNFLFGRPGAIKRRASSDGWTSAGVGTFRIGRSKTLAGPLVDEDLALTYAAVWACTRILAESVAGLPLNIYRRKGQDRELADDHPLYDMIHNQPNDDIAGQPFREGRTMHQVNWGNGFAEIERNGFNEPVALYPIHPSRVRPPQPNERARGIAYYVRNNDGSESDLARNEMLHIPGALSEDGRWGKGVVTHARESIGFGMGTERHGAGYFGSGGQPKGLVTAPGMKDKETRRQYRAEWKEVHGSPDSNEIAILPLESTFVPITISMEDSQFLETRRQNDVVISMWYGVALHLINNMDKATLNNVEQRGLEFAIYSLMPWVRKQEGEYNGRLLTKEERREYFIEHNFAGLLRGDLKTRIDSYVEAIQNGIMTINECRRLENFNSIGPAGDQHFVQLNMTTAERILSEPDPKQALATQSAAGAPAKKKPVDDDQEGTQNDDTDAEARAAAQRKALVDVLRETLARMFRKEAAAMSRATTNNALDFSEWLKAFHLRHCATIADAVATPCRALALDPGNVARYCVAISATALRDAYDHDTPAQMQARLEAWGETMAANAVTHLTQQL